VDKDVFFLFLPWKKRGCWRTLLLSNAEDWRAVEKYRITVQYFERQWACWSVKGKFFRSIYLLWEDFVSALLEIGFMLYNIIEYNVV